ncbi:hypothetical protein H4R33_006617 [Dimargaris cristalligena]|nr:hypothetical protein H4R33_006617 [Dimargaris cristalligena]
MILSVRFLSLVGFTVLLLTVGWLPALPTATATPVNQSGSAASYPRPITLVQLWDIVRSGFESLLSQTTAGDDGNSPDQSSQPTTSSAASTDGVSTCTSYQGTTTVTQAILTLATTTTPHSNDDSSRQLTTATTIPPPYTSATSRTIRTCAVPPRSQLASSPNLDPSPTPTVP